MFLSFAFTLRFLITVQGEWFLETFCLDLGSVVSYDGAMLLYENSFGIFPRIKSSHSVCVLSFELNKNV